MSRISSTWCCSEQNYRTERPNHQLQDENGFYSILTYSRSQQLCRLYRPFILPLSSSVAGRRVPQLPAWVSSSVFSSSRRRSEENSFSYLSQSIGDANASSSSKARKSFSIAFLRSFVSFSCSMSFVVRRYPALQFFCKQTKPLPKKISGKKVQVYSMRRV